MSPIVPEGKVRVTTSSLGTDEEVSFDESPERALIQLIHFLNENPTCVTTKHCATFIGLLGRGDNKPTISMESSHALPEPFHLAMNLFGSQTYFGHLKSNYVREVLDELQDRFAGRQFNNLLAYVVLAQIASFYLKGLKSLALKRDALHEIIVRATAKMEGGSLDQVAAMLIVASQEEDPALAILTLLDVPFGQPAMV